jgi:F0F1-type ATP synthase epsilon subunit
MADKEQAKNEDGKQTLKVKVAAPFRTYFDEQAVSISGVNRTGPFDILPGHHNFITLLEASELNIHTPANEEKRIRINGGVMHVKADAVNVFLDV